MWTLEKPELQKAFDDIKAVIAASKGKLIADDEPKIRMIYQTYDDNHGFISKGDNYSLCGKQRKTLEGLYNKTYSVNGKAGDLYFLREELFDAVSECPMCGTCSPHQLDHQMPKSEYESLAVCRLNLVPLCGVCNNKKRKKNSLNFVHPYYAQFPKNVVFLIAKIDVDVLTSRVSWQYDIDGSGIKNVRLLEQINNQVSVVELFKRLNKETNSWLSDIFYGKQFQTDEELKHLLLEECIKNKDLRGMNHWRTALMSALYNKREFTYQVANKFAGQIRPLNGNRNT